MSRLADQLTDVKPIAFTDQLPLIFRGGRTVPNMGLNAVTKPGVDDRQAALIKRHVPRHQLGARCRPRVRGA